MAIPKFQETFIPILTVLSDGKMISTGDLKKCVFDKYYKNLPGVLEEKTKSGDSLIFNRIAWGKTYLKQAGLISQPERAIVQITAKGRAMLNKGELHLKDLFKDEEFVANRNAYKDNKDNEEVASDETPQDLIDKGFRSIENQIKIELLSKLRESDPYNFEKIVLKLLERMGYGDFIETPKSGDGGIDGIIKEDKLGLDKIYIQAKRYSDGNKVRETEIRNFIGAISRDTNKGVFVTTSVFDEKAIQKARDANQKIILIDGQNLVDLMYRYNIGIQIKDSYELKEIDGDFFEEN